jgi:hypothetical protein
VLARWCIVAALVAAGCAAREVYRRDRDDPREVEVRTLPEQEVAPGRRARPLAFESKMTIDADGAGDAWKGDPDGQPETSLTDAAGRSLDPTRTPYFVLPEGFAGRHPPLRLGDIAAVRHEGRLAFAIFGDEGPRGLLGEGSIALARALGIDPDPVRGGTDGGVEYTVFPGSGDGAPLAPDEIARRGARLLRAGR